MRGPVRVDVNSTVVAYRPAEGEERILAARDVKPAALLSGHPWRTFRLPVSGIIRALTGPQRWKTRHLRVQTGVGKINWG